jgi:hypothetical protein
MGEVGSDPRAGYFFQRSSVPPRSPLHYQLENEGAMKTDNQSHRGPDEAGHWEGVPSD